MLRVLDRILPKTSELIHKKFHYGAIKAIKLRTDPRSFGKILPLSNLREDKFLPSVIGLM